MKKIPRSYRFSEEDVETILRLQRRWAPLSEIGVLKRALHEAEKEEHSKRPFTFSGVSGRGDSFTGETTVPVIERD